MMNLEGALLNWLQISLVADARPDDAAARETADFFYTILQEDHRVDSAEIIPFGEDMLQIHYRMNGEMHRKTYDRNHAYQLLQSINENPKYNE